MNINWQRLIGGVLLSFIPLFSFVFLVSGSQSYLLSEKKQSEEDALLANISVASNMGGDLQVNEEIKDNVEISDTGEEIQKNNIDEVQVKEPELKSALSIETNLLDEQKIIFKKSSNSILPIASLTKLMTAVVSFDNYDLSESVTVSKEADSQSSMKIDLKEGDTFSIAEVLHIMLVESSNKAAYALSEKMGEEDFVFLMNKKASQIGLKNTYFSDPTGLSSSNVSTTEDLAALAEYILSNYPDIAQMTIAKNYTLDNFGEIKNTNNLLSEFSEIVLGKTGFTNSANGCLLVALFNPENNNYTINVVLGADDRFLEMRKLINSESTIDNNNNN